MKNNQKGFWLPKKGSKAYFKANSDDEFKKKHPIGYGFLVALGIFALLLPMGLYVFYCALKGYNSAWMVLGYLGCFIVGTGLFNFVAIIIKQYLGHLLSLICFLVGGGLIALSLILI